MNNDDLLYEMIHDFIDQNSMEVGKVVAVLETIKMEYLVKSIMDANEE